MGLKIHNIKPIKAVPEYSNGIIFSQYQLTLNKNFDPKCVIQIEIDREIIAGTAEKIMIWYP